MKLQVILANPAGNITAFVKNPEISREDYKTVSAILMENSSEEIEQVGFIRPAIMGGQSRLEMMGGEFCGNAARSFGYYVASLTGCDKALIEITGNSQCMEILSNQKEGSARAQMPIPHGIRDLQVGEKAYPWVPFDGIDHVIAEGEAPDEDHVKEIIEAICREKDSECVGVMYLDRANESMHPVVWVREVGSMIHENSCGSGSVAAGVFLTDQEADGVYIRTLKQPGGEIRVEIHKEQGRPSAIFIDGPVKLSPETTMEIPDLPTK